MCHHARNIFITSRYNGNVQFDKTEFNYVLPNLNGASLDKNIKIAQYNNTIRVLFVEQKYLDAMMNKKKIIDIYYLKIWLGSICSMLPCFCFTLKIF